MIERESAVYKYITMDRLYIINIKRLGEFWSFEIARRKTGKLVICEMIRFYKKSFCMDHIKNYYQKYSNFEPLSKYQFRIRDETKKVRM